MTLTKRNGYVSDAEAAGKMAVEILSKRCPKTWLHLGDSEPEFIGWLCRWAFHWAIKAEQFTC